MRMPPLFSSRSCKPPRVSVTLVILAVLAITPDAQQQVIISGPPGEAGQMPGMPGQRQFKTGTGRISGRVLTLEGTPLRRAQVRISGAEVASKAALTDAEGRYEFRDLPAGRFTLTATKSGYVTLQFGQTRPYEAGKPIELGENQRLAKADIAMPRGGVIAGRILDEFGDPVPEAMVSAMRSTWAGGRRRLVTAARSALTNDLGQYRLFGLTPGEYYVNASIRGGENMMFDMGPAAAVAHPTASNPGSGYAPTYYPGTANAAEAQKIDVAAGQEAQSTDFVLQPVRLSRVSGTVISSEGKPVESAMVNAMQRSTEMGGMVMPHTARTDRTGAFTLSGLPPGDYVLQTRSVQVSSGSDGNFSVRVAGPDGPGGDPEFGTLPITIGSEEMSNVTIVTSKGTTASGRVTFDGAPPPNVTALRLAALPAADETMPMMFGPGGPGQTLSADGTFELKGLFGRRYFRLLNAAGGWMIDSVRLDGQDVTDSGVEFKAGDRVSGIEVVVTTRPAELSGSVKNSDGSVATDYTVIVFSEDPDKWTVPMSRYISSARPDQQGRFRVRNLAPGAYHAIAVEYIEQGTWGDPEILERLKGKAVRVSLARGENKTMDLELTRSVTR
jgi:Carboxypeptidase regulatory-like domain